MLWGRCFSSPNDWVGSSRHPPTPFPRSTLSEQPTLRVTSAGRAGSKGCYHVGRVIKPLMNECL